MKLYTRSGDDGTTGLFGEQRVKKDHPRIDACGHVDELNACLGWILALITDHPPSAPKPGHSAVPPRVGPASLAPFHDTLQAILTTIQSRLFDLGADLATPSNSKHELKVKRISSDHVVQAERWIDEVDAGNSPIAVFILPGGTELASRLHVARTVCRRAERAMVHLSQSESINPQAMIFINRLSDLLFAMARRVNKEAGVPDVAWGQ